MLPVFGRLGSVEAGRFGLAEPGPAFAYVFEFEVDPDKRAASVRAKYVRGLWTPLRRPLSRGAKHERRI